MGHRERLFFGPPRPPFPKPVGNPPCKLARLTCGSAALRKMLQSMSVGDTASSAGSCSPPAATKASSSDAATIQDGARTRSKRAHKEATTSALSMEPNTPPAPAQAARPPSRHKVAGRSNEAGQRCVHGSFSRQVEGKCTIVRNDSVAACIAPIGTRPRDEGRPPPHTMSRQAGAQQLATPRTTPSSGQHLSLSQNGSMGVFLLIHLLAPTQELPICIFLRVPMIVYIHICMHVRMYVNTYVVDACTYTCASA